MTKSFHYQDRTWGELHETIGRTANRDDEVDDYRSAEISQTFSIGAPLAIAGCPAGHMQRTWRKANALRARIHLAGVKNTTRLASGLRDCPPL
jgi:hypothetical protein